MMEWNAHFMEEVVVLNLSLKETRKLGQQIWNFLLKDVFGLNTILSNQRIITGTFIKKVTKKLFFPWFIVSFNIYKTSKNIQMEPI